MPKVSRSSFDSLIQDIVTRTVRAEVESLQREVASLRAALSKRGGSIAAASPAPGRRRKGRRGGARTPGTMKPKQVKAIRAKLGVSQKKFADLAGVTPVAVYFWESGKTTPSLETERVLKGLVSGGKH